MKTNGRFRLVESNVRNGPDRQLELVKSDEVFSRVRSA